MVSRTSASDTPGTTTQPARRIGQSSNPDTRQGSTRRDGAKQFERKVSLNAKHDNARLFALGRVDATAVERVVAADEWLECCDNRTGVLSRCR
jgi:hypothetical protein